MMYLKDVNRNIVVMAPESNSRFLISQDSNDSDNRCLD